MHILFHNNGRTLQGRHIQVAIHTSTLNRNKHVFLPGSPRILRDLTNRTIGGALYRERHNASQEFLELHDGVAERKERKLRREKRRYVPVRTRHQKKRHSSRNNQGVSREMRPDPGRSATRRKKRKDAYHARRPG